MTLPVSLQAVIDEMDTFGDEFHPYLNRHTGELVTISSEEIQAVEEGDDLDDYPDWQQDLIQKAAEILSSAAYLPLPSKFEIHEYAIMERFCLALAVCRRDMYIGSWKRRTKACRPAILVTKAERAMFPGDSHSIFRAVGKLKLTPSW